MDLNTLLAPDASAQRSAVKKSLVPHPDAVLGSFASRTIEKSIVIGYYNDSFVYSNLTKVGSQWRPMRKV